MTGFGMRGGNLNTDTNTEIGDNLPQTKRFGGLLATTTAKWGTVTLVLKVFSLSECGRFSSPSLLFFFLSFSVIGIKTEALSYIPSPLALFILLFWGRIWLKHYVAQTCFILSILLPQSPSQSVWITDVHPQTSLLPSLIYIEHFKLFDIILAENKQLILTFLLPIWWKIEHNKVLFSYVIIPSFLSKKS